MPQKDRFFVVPNKGMEWNPNPGLWTVGERLNDEGLWFPLNYTVGWFSTRERAEERAAAFNAGEPVR